MGHRSPNINRKHCSFEIAFVDLRFPVGAKPQFSAWGGDERVLSLLIPCPALHTGKVERQSVILAV